MADRKKKRTKDKQRSTKLNTENYKELHKNQLFDQSGQIIIFNKIWWLGLLAFIYILTFRVLLHIFRLHTQISAVYKYFPLKSGR
jgi:hypothetical protein